LTLRRTRLALARLATASEAYILEAEDYFDFRTVGGPWMVPKSNRAVSRAPAEGSR
jgi:hypothetical protein